jgi:hypothetical protein
LLPCSPNIEPTEGDILLCGQTAPCADGRWGTELVMAMPPQLARGLQAKRQSRRGEQRPIVEQLPYININDLRQAIPRNYGTNIYSNPFRYPQIQRLCPIAASK